MDAAVGTLKFENKAVIPTDPRTKLFLTVTVSTIMITGGTGGIKAQDLTTFRILLQENYYSYQNIEVGPPRRFQGAAE